MNQKHILCEFKYKVDRKKRNSNEKWNNNKYWCSYKCDKKIIFGILLYVLAKIVNI